MLPLGRRLGRRTRCPGRLTVLDPKERRRNPRLGLSYPIETQISEPGEVGGARAVTVNLGARGAYFKTFSGDCFRVGQKVSVRIRVPHGIHSGKHQVDLKLIQVNMDQVSQKNQVLLNNLI